MEERGREWGKAETQGLHWQILSWARLGPVKAGASPSLSLHPYRPVAAVSCVRLPAPAGFWHVSAELPVAGILGVQALPSQWSRRRGEQARGEAEAGSSCDLCLFPEIRLLSSCSLTCCLLLIIILFLYLSLQKHAHSPLLHGNHLLVSLSCSAASVIHNIPPADCPPPLSSTGMGAAVKTCLLGFYSPFIHFPPRLFFGFHRNESPTMWQEYHSWGRRRNAASCCSWPVNTAAKVFFVQRSRTLRVCFKDIYIYLPQQRSPEEAYKNKQQVIRLATGA